MFAQKMTKTPIPYCMLFPKIMSLYGIHNQKLPTNELGGEWNSSTLAKMHIVDEVEGDF